MLNSVVYFSHFCWVKCVSFSNYCSPLGGSLQANKAVTFSCRASRYVLCSHSPLPAGINRKVVYSLASSADGFFSIDGSSGIIVLEQPLDREQQSSYNISVQAADQSPGRALSSLATVTITVLDINDNPPMFERRDYLVTVPEDTSPGTQVLAVFATSKDIGTNAEITYLIRSGNEQGKFRINPKTGG